MERGPVKVLAVVRRLYRGGLESRLLDIVKVTDRSRVQIDIFCCSDGSDELDGQFLSQSARIYYNPPLTLRNMNWYVRYFRRFLLEHPEYRIVHAHQNAWCSVFCKGAYRAGVPIRIAHSRTAVTVHTVKGAAQNIVRLPARKYATHFFAVSGEAGIWLFGKKNFEEGRVRIWKNAIDCQKYRFNREVRDRMRRELGVGHAKVLMHVGNFTPPKNQAFLIGVVEQLKEEMDILLFFVGKEKAEGLMARARESVRRKKLERWIRFLGGRDDVEDLLQAADVFCFPSLFEGLPGAVLEAQAAGLPCVISSAITHEVCVLKTTRAVGLKNSEKQWCEAIREGLEAERRDTFEEMALAGFDIHTLAESLTKFYESAEDEYNALSDAL